MRSPEWGEAAGCGRVDAGVAQDADAPDNIGLRHLWRWCARSFSVIDRAHRKSCTDPQNPPLIPGLWPWSAYPPALALS